MLEFDRVITVFTCSLVHTAAVIHLNIKNIRQPFKVYFKLFAASFIIHCSALVLIHKPYIYFTATLFLVPLCTFHIYRLGIAEAFALSTVSDIIILFGELAEQELLNKMPAINPQLPYKVKYIVAKNLTVFFIMAMVIAIARLIRKRPLNKRTPKNIIYHIVFLVMGNVILNIVFLLSKAPFDKIHLANFSYKTCVYILMIYILTLSSIARFEHRSKKYIQLNKYIQTIEEMYDDLARQKHDFSNILLSINGYINDNRISELRDYMNNYVMRDFCKSLNNNFAVYLKYIQNPALKGVIFSKLNQAAMKNIKLFINIFNEIEIHNIDPTDLARIIGILFDNAIEACEKSPQNELHLGMESDKTHTSILIGNTCYQMPDLELICNRGYSTKGKNRGLGLYSLKKILALYPNAHLKTSVSDNMFFQELIIMK